MPAVKNWKNGPFWLEGLSGRIQMESKSDPTNIQTIV